MSAKRAAIDSIKLMGPEELFIAPETSITTGFDGAGDGEEVC